MHGPLPDDPELARLIKTVTALEDNPENREPAGSLWIYNAATRKKTEKLARQITERMAVLRAERGDPVKDCGYTGPKQNRRR